MKAIALSICCFFFFAPSGELAFAKAKTKQITQAQPVKKTLKGKIQIAARAPRCNSAGKSQWGAKDSKFSTVSGVDHAASKDDPTWAPIDPKNCEALE